MAAHMLPSDLDRYDLLDWMIEQGQAEYQLAADAVLSGYSACNAIEGLFIWLLYPKIVTVNDVVDELEANNASQKEIALAGMLINRQQVILLQMQASFQEEMSSMPGPSFFNSHLQEVDLPLELYNEPYSWYDNEYRAEIVTLRDEFRYEIRGSTATCSIRDGMIEGEEQDYTTPSKATSNVSVLTVYDTYGLQVTYAFLKNLYSRKYQQDAPDWLMIYLEGSMMAIDPAYEESGYQGPYSILYLCLLIYSELELIDRETFRPLDSLEPSSMLPTDIVARITGSERISKAVTLATRTNRDAAWGL
ncbi:Hypothetical protein POVR2_LOCUS38 [uncultured virus]|nr:Hypothetical protein POVR2_LOCUS38 [uncultured virus]